MRNAVDRLIEGIHEKKNPTALGLDTQLSHLPEGFLDPGAGRLYQASAIVEFNKSVMETLADIVPCVKVQIAYYELLGTPGIQAFQETLKTARRMGFFVIVDGKRNDIGATAQAYAQAYLTPGADFECDMLTVNGYLGIDGIKPFLDLSAENEKGAFMLVKTSNPSSGQLQDRMVDGRTVYEMMGDFAEEWGAPTRGEYGYSAIGAVVGATYPEQGAELRKRLPHTFFLVPGYGAQGASGKELRGCFDQNGDGAVVNASRSLLTAHQKSPRKHYLDAIRAEALRMREDLGFFKAE